MAFQKPLRAACLTQAPPTPPPEVETLDLETARGHHPERNGGRRSLRLYNSDGVECGQRLVIVEPSAERHRGDGEFLDNLG
jgi:hypothetical protein